MTKNFLFKNYKNNYNNISINKNKKIVLSNKTVTI